MGGDNLRDDIRREFTAALQYAGSKTNSELKLVCLWWVNRLFGAREPPWIEIAHA
jgi:hypothetical protein